MSGRTMLTLAAVVVGAVTAFVAGIALRPALVDDASTSPRLSAVETGYLQDMVTHHQQAITMAQLVDRDGIAAPVRGIARQMLREQSGEVGTMIGFLQLADEPIQSPAPMRWMHRYSFDGEHDHGANTGAAHPMPGMVTESDVAAIGSRSGVAAENLFLQLMQRHHYGGIAMTQDLLSYGPSDGPVVRLARTIVNTQTKETGLMGAMIQARGIPVQ